VNRLFGSPTGTNAGGARGAGGTTAGDRLTIEGYLGQERVSIGPAGPNSSAKEIAKAVNAVQSGTGVSATARTELEVTGLAAGNTYTLQIEAANIGQQPPEIFNFSPIAGVPSGTDFSAAITAFNLSQTSTVTGVEMSVNAAGDGIILTSAAGDNITFGVPTAALGSPGLPSPITLKTPNSPLTDSNSMQTLVKDAAGQTRIFTGQVVFDSERAFTVIEEPVATLTPFAVITAPAAHLGLVLKKPGGAATPRAVEGSKVISLSTIDVTEGPASIREAFAIIDGALAAVATQRAALGSAQNRFNSIIDNLGRDFVNLKKARSFIQDADMGLEASIQSSANIQHQVNIAILGQANALQQAVLALLR